MEYEITSGESGVDRSSETRARILDAALGEFSSLGMAGARMDQIAAAAGVNKALLYYHFDSKENLYIAAVEMISAKIRDQSMAVLMKVRGRCWSRLTRPLATILGTWLRMRKYWGSW